VAASNINVVVITGNLTKDPELRSTGGGTSVCELRVAVNSSRKNYLSKGRPVAVEGRLDWSEWEAKDGSGKRQKVQIVAKSVQFLGSRDGGGGGGGGGNDSFTPSSDVPADSSDFAGAAAGGGGGDDDIPF
jgi:single-strand DNA-binding protein